MIEPITVHQVRCDHRDHVSVQAPVSEHAVSVDGLLIDEDDGPMLFDTREDALKFLRSYWQVTTEGVFCPDHVTDTTPLDQPGLTLLESAAFDEIVAGALQRVIRHE